MSRRITILAISVFLGMCAGTMLQGKWPGYSWTGGAGNVSARESGVSVTDKILIASGMTAVRGPGIRLALEDSEISETVQVPQERLLVHERHLLLLSNELFSAGAEAVSINGNRLVAATEIRCAGPVISINGRGEVPPYVIEAVGNPVLMKQSVMMMGGIVELLAMDGIQVIDETTKEITVPAFVEKKPVGKVVRNRKHD